MDLKEKLALELARADLAEIDRNLLNGEKIIAIASKKQDALAAERALLVEKIERMLAKAE